MTGRETSDACGTQIIDFVSCCTPEKSIIQN
jgi:hypothetical protein